MFTKKKNSAPVQKDSLGIAVPFFVTGLIVLLLYEIFSFCVSSYQANSILFLRDFFVILLFVYIIHRLITKKKYRTYFVVFISLLAGISAFLNLPVFYFRYFEAGIYGFDDFSQFRFLYRPLGFLSNDWVAIMLCFLPFPVIALFQFWRKKQIRYGFLLIVGLLVFNILISFSRAGLLAFLLFVLLMNLLLYSYRIVPIKKLLLSNIVLIFAISLFCLAFAGSIQSSITQSNSHRRSTEGRISQWEQTVEVIRKYPFRGIGSKNYALSGRLTQQANFESAFTGRVNNSYLQLSIEKGIIGLLLWLSVIGICLVYRFRQLTKETHCLEKTIHIIVFSAIISILFRELFFSSLFYNSGILFLFLALLVFNQENEYERIKVQKSITFAFIGLFTAGVFFFYTLKPENALTYATMGLEYERKGDLENAIQCYKKASRLSSTDALFLHNLGRLYEKGAQLDSAMYYLKQAVATDPEVAIYHVSLGLLTEKQDFENACRYYKQAILLSPDIIDSQFFKDLRKRYSIETEHLLKDAYNELLQINTVRYSSVIDAKKGKLQLSMSEIEQAYKTLTHVIQIHPNLSRPWFYLGLLEQKNGNHEKMLSCYRKSLFLSPSDHLPLYALASYYREIGDEQSADSYQKSADRAWKNKHSIHSSRCKRMYFMDTEKDNIVPKGFLDYITPIFESR